MSAGSEEGNAAVIRRFYDELWNRWRLDLVEELIAEAVTFRGSLGTVCHGRSEFKRYVADVQVAFPDWHNRIDELVSYDNRVVTRMTWTGTHRGPLGNLEPTRARVEYAGAGFFHVNGDLIEEAWVVGDSQELWRALGVLPQADG